MGITLRQNQSGEFLQGTALGQALIWTPSTEEWEPGPLRGKGVWHVDDFGAVSLPTTLTPIPNNEQAFRNNNNNAFNAALQTAFAAGGGTVLYGPGIYYTDATNSVAPIGFNLTADTSVGITFQGLGPWPCLIWATDNGTATKPAFQLQTSTGNVRFFYMKDVAIRGGKCGLSLNRANYCRFDRVFFWGSDQFALQDILGAYNVFNECYGTESGARGDYAYFESSEDLFANNSFGELCGGVVVSAGYMRIANGTMYGMSYRGKNAFNYVTNTPIDLSALQTGNGAAFNNLAGGMFLSGITGSPEKLWLKLHSAFQQTIIDCNLQSGLSPSTPPGNLEGYIKVTANPASRCALNIQASQFFWRSIDNGYFISEPGALLHNAIVQAQLLKDPGATITPIGTSAPALLNPGGENNFVVLPIFNY